MTDQELEFLLGDSFTSPQWAVVLNGASVDLSIGGWVARAQARLRPESALVLFEWSTTNGRIVLGTATVTLSTGVVLTTSTVQLRHEPADVVALQPFIGRYDLQISRTGLTKTIKAGPMVALRDVTR